MARTARTPADAAPSTPASAPDDAPGQVDGAPGLAQFEDSLGELEGLVETLESGDISLEDALAKFERGVLLTRQCQGLLKNAELRVDQLMAQGGQADDVQPLDPGPSNSDD